MNVLRSLVIFFGLAPLAFSSSLDATDQQNISTHFNAYVDAGKILDIRDTQPIRIFGKLRYRP